MCGISLKNMKLISFYTEDTQYEDLAHTFRESAGDVGLDSITFRAKNYGDWAKNCNQKAAFIYTAYHMFPEDDILYVDIDATFNSYPKALEEYQDPFDIGYHSLRDTELLSGTLIFRHSATSANILKHWIYHSKKSPKVWDQRTLQNILDANDHKLFPLDASLCYIFDISKKIYPDVVPVIVHHQASRKYRKIINASSI